MAEFAMCPDCGRRIMRRWNTDSFVGHYSATNPPVYGAWENCPGPTPEQKRSAAAWRAQQSRMGRATS